MKGSFRLVFIKYKTHWKWMINCSNVSSFSIIQFHISHSRIHSVNISDIDKILVKKHRNFLFIYKMSIYAAFISSYSIFSILKKYQYSIFYLNFLECALWVHSLFPHIFLKKAYLTIVTENKIRSPELKLRNVNSKMIFWKTVSSIGLLISLTLLI